MEKLTSILVIAEGDECGTKLLEKAIVLARGFRSRVALLPTDNAAFKHLAAVCAQRGYDEVVLCSVSRGPEPFEDVILRRVFETSPDLVVKALTPAENGQTNKFDPADQRLAAACPVPLILMRQTPWRSPLRIAAAVDVTNEAGAMARSIVSVAGFLSLGLGGELDVIYSERERQDEVLRMARAVKLARLVREFHVEGEHLHRIDGLPEDSLVSIASSGDYDMLILGAITHRTGLAKIHGSLTRKLVVACKGDVVLIKETMSQAAWRGADPSNLEQGSDQAEQFA